VPPCLTRLHPSSQNSLRKEAIINAGILIGKPEGNRIFGRRKRTWENNIKMGLKKQNVRTVTGYIRRRYGPKSAVINLQFPQNVRSFFDWLLKKGNSLRN
jgi:hypothetical protein